MSLSSRHIVLFTGSAVSSAAKPSVPGVRAFLTEVCRAVADSPRADQLTKHYATELLCGAYKAVLENTTFEEFLWHLQRASDVDARHELLRDIYAYPPGCFNLNHLAVETLLHQRIAVACFTTNFDNGIEEAFYYLTNTSLSKVVYPQDPLPHKLPDPHGQPLLIKLHGDAIAKNCVATSPELFEKGISAYHGLPTLLRGHLTLLLGYSGTGDIDIAPHLKSVVADLIWGVLPRSHNAVVHWAERLVECHLGSADPTQNLLMGFVKHRLPPSSQSPDFVKVLMLGFAITLSTNMPSFIVYSNGDTAIFLFTLASAHPTTSVAPSCICRLEPTFLRG